MISITLLWHHSVILSVPIMVSIFYIIAAATTLFHSELKHKAGFNIPERLLDEPVEVRGVELADLPPI
jgi:hypothetical protein